MTTKITNVMCHAKAAPWPYMSAVGSLMLAIGLKAVGVAHWSSGNIFEASVFGGWGVCWLVVMFFALADGVSRYREYTRIKSMLLRYGFNERILQPVAQSRCQRDAALHAARETGYIDQTRAFYRSLGYRWYHILPDSVVRNPFVFVSPTFLQTSFMPGKKLR